MIFGFVSGVATQGEAGELCIVADKASGYSIPVKVKTLRPTDAAVHLISNEEAVTVAIDANDQGMIISPVRPSMLYLTPNMPEKPGFKVDKVKVIPQANNTYRCFFDRGRGWENWTPNIRIY